MVKAKLSERGRIVKRFDCVIGVGANGWVGYCQTCNWIKDIQCQAILHTRDSLLNSHAFASIIGTLKLEHVLIKHKKLAEICEN